MDWSTQTHRYRDDKQGKIVGKARTRQPLGKEKGGEREGVRSATVQHTGAGASSRSLDVRVASKRDSLDLYFHSWTRMPSLKRRREGERPVLSAANIPPLLLSSTYPCPFLSLENRDSLFLSPPSLPPSLRFHAFPAGSELLFAREPRCRPLCLASVCILIVGPLSLLYLALPDVKKEREREREGRVVNPRDPFQSSVSTIVVVFTDARFSEETSSIDASRRVRTDESWWLRTRLEWISKRIRVEWSSVLFMGCTTVNKVFGKSWDAEI